MSNLGKTIKRHIKELRKNPQIIKYSEYKSLKEKIISEEYSFDSIEIILEDGSERVLKIAPQFNFNCYDSTSKFSPAWGSSMSISKSFNDQSVNCRNCGAPTHGICDYCGT